MSPEVIISLLGLKPHPEGGFYRETFRDGAGQDGRSHGTAIYYLLRAGEISRWHRVDAAEIWHWYAGEALELLIHDEAGSERLVLGPSLDRGERPQAVVPPYRWQCAKPLGVFALMGCTVAPGFLFSGFELATEGWSPS